MRCRQCRRNARIRIVSEGKHARSALRIQELAGNRARLGAGTSRCADDLETLSMLADAVLTFSIECLR